MLKNTGNGEDTYTVSITNGVSGTGVGLFDATTDPTDRLRVVIDANNNGQVDIGEEIIAYIGSDGTLTVEPDHQVMLVVYGTTLTTGKAGATLTIKSGNNGTNGIVEDITDGNGGRDGLNGTNEDIATVVTGAVVNTGRVSTYDYGQLDDDSDDTITYSMKIDNTSDSSTYNVDIKDELDMAHFNITSESDIIITGTEEFDQAGDIVPKVTNDANNDGIPGDFAIIAFDDELPAGASIDFEYKVPVKTSLGIEDQIENNVVIKMDHNNDNDYDDPGEQEETVDKTEPVTQQIYGVNISDTGSDAHTSVNDGGDDDGVADDKQTVDNIQSGETAVYSSVIKNYGNGIDTFQLSVPNAGTSGQNEFPVGTSFTFWHDGGVTVLTDTDNGIVDTGPLNHGESRNVVVKAKLPANVYNGDGTHTGSYFAYIKVTSGGDNTQSDTIMLKLGNIGQPSVDLSNSPGKTIDASDHNPTSNNHAYDGTPIATKTSTLGANLKFFLTIKNNTGISDSFKFYIGSTYDGKDLGPLHDGWTHIFHDVNDNVISQTPVLSPGEIYLAHVEVYLPTDTVKALNNFESDFDVDGNADSIDGNNDGDGDYPVFIKIESNNNPDLFDVTMDAVDVEPVENISMTSERTGQVETNESIIYEHTLKNTGNTVELVKIIGSNNWSNSILMDTTGDKVPDTLYTSLTTGTPIYYYNANEEYLSQNFGGSDLSKTKDDILLKPGEHIDFKVQVTAPSNVQTDSFDSLVVSVSYNDGAEEIENTVITTLKAGQLEATKTVAIDANCDGIPDEAFSGTANTDVAPGECAIWQMIITNVGMTDALKVKAYDAIPPFSTYVPGSIISGAGDAGQDPVPAVTLVANTDADDDATAENHDDNYFGKLVGGDIILHLGTGATQLEGGVLAPAESVSFRFSTKVD